MWKNKVFFVYSASTILTTDLYVYNNVTGVIMKYAFFTNKGQVGIATEDVAMANASTTQASKIPELNNILQKVTRITIGPEISTEM